MEAADSVINESPGQRSADLGSNVRHDISDTDLWHLLQQGAMRFPAEVILKPAKTADSIRKVYFFH